MHDLITRLKELEEASFDPRAEHGIGVLRTGFKFLSDRTGCPVQGFGFAR